MQVQTKYKATYISDVISHLGEGYTLAPWAGSIGVSRDTVYEWASVHPEFSDAIKKGRTKGQTVWEVRLANQAMTGAGNIAAIIFAMKNLYQDDWADKIVNELTGKDGAPLNEGLDTRSLAKAVALVGLRRLAKSRTLLKITLSRAARSG